MKENAAIEKKSLKIVQDNTANWKKLAKEAVCMANAYGGKLLIGIEDESDLPPEGQTIDENLPHIVVRKIEQNTINVGLQPQIITAANKAQYLELTVLRSASNIACTSDAKYYIRVSDECKPLLPDELGRLMVDKNAFVWETHVYQKVPYKNCDEQKLNDFRNQILRSLWVSDFVKQKSIEELLDYYFFKKDDYLTNLGVLWIGKRQHRANLRFATVIQFIKYDVYGEKVNKLVWDNYDKNPQQLLEAVWNEIPDWKEHIEITDGLFKKQIANYSEKVVRELVVNALVHKPYTIRGDIFINLFPNKMEIHNPGLFPLGVTASNILHQSRRRNDNLAKVFYDLNLMEREVRGYDEIYEDLLSNGKPLPITEEGNDRVIITITKRIVSNEVMKLMDRGVFYQ